MNDKKIDKILSDQLKKDTQIPDKINELFKRDYSIYQNITEKVETKNNKVRLEFLKYATIVASLVIVIFTGGSTFAHINGIETPISDLLRKLGINSKYEQNATEINETIINEKVEVKLLNVAIDETSLIVGYEFSSERFNEDSWIDVYGTYRVNNLNLNPLSQSMDKDEKGKIVMYQVFDINEIELNKVENVNFVIEISNIEEYTEVEDLNGAYKEKVKEYEGNWRFEKNIILSNMGECKEYELEENTIEILPNINVSITEWVQGSYTNMLKIKTDKTNYKGDYLDKYYKILDSKNNEIAVCKEEREYDDNRYTERAIFEKIPSDSKLKVEVYSQKAFGGIYEKVSSIEVDLDNAKEKKISKSAYKRYSDDNYEFEYNGTWINRGIVDANRVSPNSIYLGALQIEIPSTSNSEYGSTISIMKKTTTQTTTQYVEEMIKQYTESLETGGYIEKSTENRIISGRNGYKVILETSDGENEYEVAKYVTVFNGNAYVIDFFGTDIEYNNLYQEIERLVNTFSIVE